MRLRHLGIALAVTAAGVLGYTTTSQGALVNISVEDNEYGPKNAEFNFLLAGTENVVWAWNGPGPPPGDPTNNEHTVTQKKNLFNSGNPTTEGEFEILASAGKYPYYCEVHRTDGMKGKVSIIPAAADLTEDTVRIHWARSDTKTGKLFDVRYKVDDGKYKYWHHNTKKKSAVFGKNDKPVAVDFGAHDYSVQARSIKGKPKNKRRSGFSPPVVVTGAR